MIKCYVNKYDPNEKVSVEAGGTIEEIGDDIGNITHAIYYNLMKQDPEGAEAFKAVILDIFAGAGTAWMSSEELLKED